MKKCLLICTLSIVLLLFTACSKKTSSQDPVDKLLASSEEMIEVLEKAVPEIEKKLLELKETGLDITKEKYEYMTPKQQKRADELKERLFLDLLSEY